MILGFSTQLNGKPTYFVTKIWGCIESNFTVLNSKGKRTIKYPKEYKECREKGLLTWNRQKPKLHTIREDTKDRWKVGNKIDFFINCRQKDMFRFAPVLPVVSTQKVTIKYHTNTFLVHIDGKLYFFGNRDFTVNEFENYKGMLQLAQNDGFDTIEDFFEYFNKDFTGKIIHWTDLRY